MGQMATTLWTEIGKALEQAREDQGLTWADVERLSGLAAPTIRDNEQGGIKTTTALDKHASALGLNVRQILVDLSDPTPITPSQRRLQDRHAALPASLQVVVLSLVDECHDLLAARTGKKASARKLSGRAPGKRATASR